MCVSCASNSLVLGCYVRAGPTCGNQGSTRFIKGQRLRDARCSPGVLQEVQVVSIKHGVAIKKMVPSFFGSNLLAIKHVW